jgi:hypothetical protein
VHGEVDDAPFTFDRHGPHGRAAAVHTCDGASARLIDDRRILNQGNVSDRGGLSCTFPLDRQAHGIVGTGCVCVLGRRVGDGGEREGGVVGRGTR